MSRDFFDHEYCTKLFQQFPSFGRGQDGDGKLQNKVRSELFLKSILNLKQCDFLYVERSSRWQNTALQEKEKKIKGN